jgi:hypothetical protein
MKPVITLLICFVGMSLQSFAQREAIDQEIERMLANGCEEYEMKEEEIGVNNDGGIIYKFVYERDLAYAVQQLHKHVNDTSPCAKIRVLNVTNMLFSYVDSSNYEEVFRYNLMYARDTSVKKNSYNLIVSDVRSAVFGKIKMPPYVQQFIVFPEFYQKTTAWKLPLLISYLDMYGEIENLKKWGKMHPLTEHAKGKLVVALLRLGDSVTTQEYVATTPTNSKEWNNYITGLNYARTKPATERLVNLLDNNDKVRYANHCDNDDPEDYYTSVRSLVLETLLKIIENFPLEKVKIPYEEDHFSEAPEKDIKKIKQWFKDNSDYKIIRRSNYNY